MASSGDKNLAKWVHSSLDRIRGIPWGCPLQDQKGDYQRRRFSNQLEDNDSTPDCIRAVHGGCPCSPSLPQHYGIRGSHENEKHERHEHR